MAAPTDDYIGGRSCPENTRISQDVKYRIGYSVRSANIEIWIAGDLVADVYDVSQYRKKVFFDSLDHHAVDKSAFGRVCQFDANPALLFQDFDFEVAVAIHEFPGVVYGGAAVEHGERTFAKYLIKAALAGIEKLGNLGLGQYVQVAFR